jgi:hypothetical protein
MLLEQLVRFHVQSQALIWRELLSWPVVLAGMWGEAREDEEARPENVVSLTARRHGDQKAA